MTHFLIWRRADLSSDEISGYWCLMPSFEQIYAHHAREYDELINAEDCDRELEKLLLSFQARTAIDVGAGTGRIARVLHAHGARVIAVDKSAAMLEVARKHLAAMPGQWEAHVADARELPIADGVADLVTAGWVFGHFREWMPEGWKAEVGRALDEMQRVAKPGAPIVVIETLGTGSTQPKPPNEGLAEYYRWLEQERGFVRRELRTDYQFASVQEAARVTGFFFGEEFGRSVTSARVPECTGAWVLKGT